MKVNFNKSFIDCFGKKVGDKQIGEQLAMLLFNMSTINNAPVSPEEKYAAYKLCNKLSTATDAVEITEDEAGLIKRIASEYFSAGAYGQIVDLVENKN